MKMQMHEFTKMKEVCGVELEKGQTFETASLFSFFLSVLGIELKGTLPRSYTSNPFVCLFACLLFIQGLAKLLRLNSNSESSCFIHPSHWEHVLPHLAKTSRLFM